MERRSPQPSIELWYAFSPGEIVDKYQGRLLTDIRNELVTKYGERVGSNMAQTVAYARDQLNARQYTTTDPVTVPIPTDNLAHSGSRDTAVQPSLADHLFGTSQAREPETPAPWQDPERIGVTKRSWGKKRGRRT